MRSLAHTKPSQLAWRAYLTAKRRVLSSLARRFPLQRLWPTDELPLGAHPPRALFRPRRDLVVGEGNDLRLCLHQRERPLRFPLDWNPPERVNGPKLFAMQLHTMEWLEALDDRRFVHAIEDWIANVPPYRRGYWLDDWNSFTVSLRTVVWMQQLARRTRGLNPDFVARAQRSLSMQLRFLERNLELDLRGNHLVKNVKALLWASCYFQGPTARRFGRLGASLLARELDQVLADGVHEERSPAYHAQVFADLIECRAVLPAGPLRERLARTLDRMAHALADLTHPDGGVSLFQDGGISMAYAPSELLDVHVQQGGVAPLERAHIELPHAGYFGARSKKSLLLVDCGAIGPDHLPAHGHGDALAFEWTLHGARIFVDAGVCEYDVGERREWSRSTRAHNTVNLDGLDQCEFWKSFRVGRRLRATLERYQPLEDGCVFEGSHDGYAHLAGRPIHRRLLRLAGRELRIEDRVDGGAGQACEARFLLHPACKVTREGPGQVHIANGRVEARFVTQGELTLVPATWSPDFGLELRTQQIVVRYGAAPCAGGVLIRDLSTAVGEPRPARVRERSRA